LFFKPVSVDKQKFIPNKNPTIGILLCANKNDAVIKFTLPENQNKFLQASMNCIYQLKNNY
jgi:hypothetical protein